MTFVLGLQQADCHHGEMREKVIEHVLKDKPYYSTVLRPGDKVTDEELREWASAMRDPYTYGDELANIAVADRWHIQLVIFRAGELLSVVNPMSSKLSICFSCEKVFSSEQEFYLNTTNRIFFPCSHLRAP